MKRFVWLLFVVGLVFCGCTFRKSDVDVIRFSSWGSASEMKVLTCVIDSFEKQNPDIKVELIHIPQDYFQKLHLLFASNMEPDVMLINNHHIPVYSKFLLDLSDIVDKREYFKTAVESMSYGGRLYAVPRDCSGLVVYYNKDIFNKKNLAYPDSDWTVNDMLRLARKITDGSCFGISYEPDIYYAIPYMNYFGGGVLDRNLRYVGDSSGSAFGLKFYKSLAYEMKVAPKPSDIGSKTVAQMFLEGRLGMHVSGRWLVPKYRACAKFDWDVVNFPCYSAHCDSTGWAISARSKKKESALRFVKFLAESRNIETFTKSGLIVPARVDTAQSEAFLKGKPSNDTAFVNTVVKSYATSVNKEYNNIINELNEKNFQSR